MKILNAVLLVAVACSGISKAGEKTPPSDFPSPDGRFAIRLVVPNTGKLKAEGNKWLIVADGNVSVAKQPTDGYIKDVFWSPNGHYVAVNNRNANSGDYLWVFALPRGILVKEPFDQTPLQEEETIGKRLPEFNSAQFYKEYIYAKGWTESNQLIVRHDVLFKNQPKYASVTLYYTISKSRLSLVRQQIEAKDR